jgi:hypothetical protein
MPTDDIATIDTKPAAAPSAAAAPSPAPSPAPATAKPATSEPSILDDVTEDLAVNPDTPAAHPATWPENWREELAGGDEKRLAELKRFKSPGDVTKSYWALRSKVSSEYVKKLPENATDEQKAAWREEMGVPKAATEYKLPEIKGHEWTEADKPIVGSFLEALHSADVPQPVVDKALGWYAEFQVQQQTAQFEADKSSKQEAEDALRSELGNEYRPSINLLGRLIKDTDVFPGEVGTDLLTARTADGRRLINNPELVKFLVGFAREKYGEASMISSNEAKEMASEAEQARQIMKTDFDRYLREGWDKKLAAANAKASGGKQGDGYARD